MYLKSIKVMNIRLKTEKSTVLSSIWTSKTIFFHFRKRDNVFFCMSLILVYDFNTTMQKRQQYLNKYQNFIQFFINNFLTKYNLMNKTYRIYRILQMYKNTRQIGIQYKEFDVLFFLSFKSFSWCFSYKLWTRFDFAIVVSWLQVWYSLTLSRRISHAETPHSTRSAELQLHFLWNEFYFILIYFCVRMKLCQINSWLSVAINNKTIFKYFLI